MVSLSIVEVLGEFPEYRVALVVAEHLAIAAERPPALAAGAARSASSRTRGSFAPPTT